MTSSETFESELTQLLPRLRRFAFALSRNGADADDLAQTTVERALRSRDQWQPGTRLDSWLYRIMRNLWIDTVRARGRRDRHEAPEDAAKDVGDDPREAMHASMELQRAMSAM
jgi:RNA polymerase sigma factor (sigma-70 family)